MRVERQCRRPGFPGLAIAIDRARLVIGVVAIGHDDVEAVDGAAQQDHDQAVSGRHRLLPPSRTGRSANSASPAALRRSRRQHVALSAHKIGTAEDQGGAQRRRRPLDRIAGAPLAMAEPKIASEPARLDRHLLCLRDSAGAPRASAVAKLMRRIVASGLSHASSVFL